MNFAQVLSKVVAAMEANGIRYALIGGFAMALRGVERATADLDFILMMEDLEKADAILTHWGYRREFHDANVSHYLSSSAAWGRIDILHAFRAPSLGMLKRADTLEVQPGLHVRVARREDLIGLKVQALTNDPDRAQSDWLDIELIVRSARLAGESLDWELIEDYLRLFGLQDRLGALRGGDA